MIVADNRPSIAEYAMMSEHVYHLENPDGEVQLPYDWTPIKVWPHDVIQSSGYFSRIYRSDERKHLVLAYQGTQSLWGDFIKTDIPALLMDRDCVQHQQMRKSIDIALEQATELGYQLSFTGHSLGGYLAEISLIFLYEKEGYYLNALHPSHFNVVTFDNPGGKRTLWRWLTQEGDGCPCYTELAANIALSTHDVMNIKFDPNWVNSKNECTGKTYYMPTLMPIARWFRPKTFRKHSMIGVLKYLKYQKTSNPELLAMHEWPQTRSNVSDYHHLTERKDVRYRDCLRQTQHQYFKETPDIKILTQQYQLRTTARFFPERYDTIPCFHELTSHAIINQSHLSYGLKELLELLYYFRQVSSVEQRETLGRYVRERRLGALMKIDYTLYNKHPDFHTYYPIHENEEWHGILVLKNRRQHFTNTLHYRQWVSHILAHQSEDSIWLLRLMLMDLQRYIEV